MAENDKKYYWLKFYRGFFKRHDIKIIESMKPHGKEYVLFYLKLLLESIDHEGCLRFSDALPYDNEMLSVVTETDVDIVTPAMELLIKFGMVEILEDETIFMTGISKLIGSESSSAERVRKHRENKKVLQSNTDVTNCNIEIEKEKEKEKDSFYKGKKSKKEKEVSFDIQKAEEQAKDNRKDFGEKKNKTRAR